MSVGRIKSAWRLDDKVFQNGMKAIDRGLGSRTPEAARAFATRFGVALLHRWPRDTNRSARGFETALNAAGCGPFPVSPIVTSRIREKLLKKLIANLKYWESYVRRQERTAMERHVDPARWPSYVRAVARHKRAENALKNFAKHDDALVLGLKQTIGNSQIGVRKKVYGGHGAIVNNGRSSVVVLVNREPHARWIEQRQRIAQHTLAEMAVKSKDAMRRALLADAPARWKRGAA